jgi:hypothetical protein
MTTEEDQLTGNARRAAELIKDRVAVRWPAGHLEIALIQVQRRRQQRRAQKMTAGMLGLGGLGLFLALGGTAHVRQVASNVMPGWLASAVRGPVAVAPSVDVAPVPQPVVEPLPAPARGLADSVPAPVYGPSYPVYSGVPARGAAVEAREGHLIQQRLVPRRQVAAARWMALAGQKRFGEAYGLLRQVPMRDLDNPDDLMLAADVARQAGRPERAVPFLERVVKEHPNEMSAQLAGFSLGKIYLDGLDDPERAARHFAAVRAMAPAGGLAQDALAREVEAWARAGMSSRAHDAAVEYVRLYPNGRRVAAVRDLGRI